MRDEIDLDNLGDEQLLELFSVADELNMPDYAGQALDVYFARHKKVLDSSPAPISNVPRTGLKGAVLRLFWRQRPVGEGRR